MSRLHPSERCPRLAVAVAAALAVLLLAAAITTAEAQGPKAGPTVDVDFSDDGLVIFAPVPPRPANRAGWPTPDGSADYMDLFVPGAPWSQAASRIDAFKIHSWMIRHYLTDAELITISDRLNAMGIALMIEAEPLDPPDIRVCNHSESFEGPYEIENLARLASLGVEVHAIAVEQPFSYGHLLRGSRACEYDVDRVVTEVFDWTQDARVHYPDVQVGSIEGLSPTFDTSANDIAHWLDSYQSITGESLAFIHMDVDWRWDAWPTIARDIEAVAGKRGIPFSLLYNGDFTRSNGADWLQTAAEHMTTFEVHHGGTPDHVNIQSWVDLPDLVLPETDPRAFTSLVNRYFGTRAEFDEPAFVNVPAVRIGDRPQITGRLMSTEGAPIGGADVAVTLIPLDAVRQTHQLEATVPSSATEAVLLVRVHVEGGVPGPADVRLYETSYVESDSGTNLVPNGDFAAGLDSWGAYAVDGVVGTADVVPSDAGAGANMIWLTATPHQEIYMDGTSFAVDPDSTFTLSADFAVDEAAFDTGNVSVAFLDADGLEIRRDVIDFESTASLTLAGSTDKRGGYSIELPKIYPGSYTVRISAPGDLDTWPAWTETTHVF